MQQATGVHFSVDGFNRFLGGRGSAATWERAKLCPCRTKRTGGSNVACVVCGGEGYTWEPPIDTVVGVSGMNGTRQFAMFAEWEKGDAVCTIPSDSAAYGAGEYDRITLTQASYRWTNLLTRGSADTLKYRQVEKIVQVWAVIGAAEVTFTPDVDYRLDGHTVTWLTGTLPVGTQYAVMYVARPEYFVFKDFVQDRPHDGGLALPRRVHLRLMELFRQSVGA